MSEQESVWRARVSEQRRHINRLEKEVLRLRETVDEPTVSAEDVERRRKGYLERIEDARDRGDVDWLADELIQQDHEKQVLIVKCARYRTEIRDERARRHRKGASRPQTRGSLTNAISGAAVGNATVSGPTIKPRLRPVDGEATHED